jgi:hypothetical protein
MIESVLRCLFTPSNWTAVQIQPSWLGGVAFPARTETGVGRELQQVLAGLAVGAVRSSGAAPCRHPEFAMRQRLPGTQQVGTRRRCSKLAVLRAL